MGLAFAAKLEALHTEVASIKTELKQERKKIEKYIVKVPKVSIQEISAFGVVNVLFSNEMYVLTRNGTSGAQKDKRELKAAETSLENPLEIIR